MTDLLFFCMATVGLTAILVDGKIFQPFRERLENRVRKQERRREKSGGNAENVPRTWSAFFLGIITCYQCCGFWSGLFCGLFFTLSRFVFAPPCFVLTGVNPMLEIIEVQRVELVFFAPFFWLLCGFVGSFLATVYLMLVELIFAKTMLCRRTNPELPPEEEHSDEEPV